MKTILIGHEELYNRLVKERSADKISWDGRGFVKLTTAGGTPILFMKGVPQSKIWVVDIQAQVELLGDQFGCVSIDSFLEAL